MRALFPVLAVQLYAMQRNHQMTCHVMQRAVADITLRFTALQYI